MSRATGTSATRIGLRESDLLHDVVTLLESGTNIVTTCTPLFGAGERLEEEGRAHILAAFERGNTSLYATGSTPGFITDQLPFALLSAQRHVNSVVIDEFSDLRRRESTPMIFEQLGLGKLLHAVPPNLRA